MKIHFIGIGGIGVSALARYFLARGETVSGSDAVESGILEELRALGAKIPPCATPRKCGARRASPPLQSGEKIDLVVYSAAVQEDNPELMEARRQGIKCQKYAQALGEITKEKFTIAVSGMHGKSTVTAMIGLIMEEAGLDPTVIVGTKVAWGETGHNSPQPPLNLRGGEPLLLESEALGAERPSPPLVKEGKNYSNFRAGKSKYLVIEADEYDRSFLNYWPKILVLLNIEEEHLDTYSGGLPDIMETFGEYVSHLPEDGILVANEEDGNVTKLVENFKHKVIFYSSSKAGGHVEKTPGEKVLDYVPPEAELRSNNKILFKLKIPGRHNIGNANAALSAVRILGVSDRTSDRVLSEFSGTWRRMEYRGEINGARIYDDYGHHPTEIKVTLAGARELLANSHKPSAKLWCVFQPHQYRRTHDLFEQFANAFSDSDRTIILPIYSVVGRESEEVKGKVNSEKLVKAIGNGKEVMYIDDFGKAAEYLRKNLQPGDVCIIMGAGDIYKLTQQLI